MRQLRNGGRGHEAWASAGLLRAPLAILLVTAAVPAARAQTPAGLGCGIEAGPQRAIAGVVDGGTVRLDDGKEVRLAGILAPSARDAGAGAGTWPPEADAIAALTAMVVGRTVAVGFAGRREDRWGRVQAHLFVAHEGTAQWVQARLVEQGHARVHPAPDGDTCSSQLLERERTARTASVGLWANAAYQVRPADRPTELARYGGTFQLVRGTVTKVGGTRALVILELASGEADTFPAAPRADVRDKPVTRSQRGSMRVVWRRSLDAGVGTTNRGLAGATVLLRGWIDVRAGPEIEVLAASQIETEARGPAAAQATRQRPAGEQPGVDSEQSR